MQIVYTWVQIQCILGYHEQIIILSTLCLLYKCIINFTLRKNLALLLQRLIYFNNGLLYSGGTNYIEKDWTGKVLVKV